MKTRCSKVWAVVSKNGRSALICVPPNIKINADVYQELIFNCVLLLRTRKHFKNQPFTFQQDFAQSDKASINQPSTFQQDSAQSRNIFHHKNGRRIYLISIQYFFPFGVFHKQKTRKF